MAKAETAKKLTGPSLTAISDVGAAVNTNQMMDEPAGEKLFTWYHR